MAMETGRASEHLQVIRTLMERAAVYRRALAPTTLVTGGLGAAAALVGWLARIESARGFGLFWIAVSVVAICGAFWVMRSQALKDREPFWSPPTRRVTQALLPPLVAGLVAALLVVLPAGAPPERVWWLPPIWMVLYGCALHAAGFFMARGIKLFGWGFMILGCACALIVGLRAEGGGLPTLGNAHGLMGATFGGLHLAYGAYLYLTEKGKNAA
jgi:hypothetical protein